jgi:hypothetical protein
MAKTGKNFIVFRKVKNRKNNNKFTDEPVREANC